jgi:hypothetical protein
MKNLCPKGEIAEATTHFIKGGLSSEHNIQEMLKNKWARGDEAKKALSVFYRLPTEGHTQGGKFRLGDTKIKNSKV